MTNDAGSSNPWFYNKRKSQEEIQAPARKRTTENDMLSTRRLSDTPNETEGVSRWFGVKQSYTNLPAQRLITELQQGRYNPYASIDDVRSRSLEHMVNPINPLMEKMASTTKPTHWAKKDEVTYQAPYIADISNDWTVNSAVPSLPSTSEQSSESSDPSNIPSPSNLNTSEQYSLMPEINPMQFVEKYGSELPTETLEEMGCDDFSPVVENQPDNPFFFQNSANRLPAFKRPPRSLT